MSAIVLDGKALAKLVEEDLKPRVAMLRARTGRTPILATILVGADPASATYVTMKGNACKRVGMESLRVHLPADTTTAALESKIRELNANPDVHGILLQHPVPKQIDERLCFEVIEARKDVDGVGCLGFGRMAMGLPAYGSCTPAGIMHLLSHHKIPLKGQQAIVVGRSPILGKPMAAMLVNADATVMVAHSRSQDLPELVGWANIVVGAVGKPELKTSWLRPGVV
ncbi:MAG TPA: tetrahydrofolate dehydrogenase/cyclohydrolase catalytic domain-containing protein, partial [Polyangia bacterium]